MSSTRYEKTRDRREKALNMLGAGPFTTAEAKGAGLTADDLRSSAVQPVLRGVYVDARTPVDHAVRCAAALRVTPEKTWLAGLSAARVLNLPAPEHDLVHVSVPPGIELRRSDMVVWRRSIEGSPWQIPLTAGAAPSSVTPATALVVQLARTLTLVDAVALADSILNRVDDRSATLAHWRSGCRRVCRIAELARVGAESSMETRLRLLLVLAGLGDVVVQHQVLLAGRARRFDLAFPEQRVAVEYDGAHHFASEDQKHLDAIRREEAQAEGWSVITVVPRGIYTDPAGTLGRIAAALEARGRKVSLAPEWQAHFPQRAR